jgi:uncharacterized membrane protein YphA (DoxX/SURF4 family)
MTTGSAPKKTFSRHFPTIARVLLGLMFFVFGLNGFLNFIPQPPKESMPAAIVAFTEAMMATGYFLKLVKGTEVLVGALLLLNRFVPLALTILAPVIVNIVAIHAFLAPSGLGMAVVILGLELYLAWSYRSAFRSMLGARVRPG